MKYCLLQLGCQMNLSDSERVRTVLEGLGYERTESEEEADLLGVVACSVRQKAIDRVYSKIHEWNEWKADRSLLTFVTGCVLPADRIKFLKLFDLVFPVNELPQLPDLLRQYGVATPASILDAVPPESAEDGIRGFWRIKAGYGSSFEAFVPIQNGCDKFCTFCAVPYTRGREVSRPSEEVLREVESLVRRGFKSITLLGQNVNSYGLDKRGAEMTFPGLLRAVGEIGRGSGREFWVYFTSPHPRDMTPEVLETIAAYPCLAKQLHLPLQSGDDKVLIRMNRSYRVEQYRGIVENIRSLLPSATLFTDIIVGFTGESAAQFESTLARMREFRYNMAYIAMYSPRPGAASARWLDDVPHEEKKRRLHVLSEELQAISLELNREMVGRTYRVLVGGRDRLDGHLTGRTEGKIIVRIPSEDASLVGRFVDARITDAARMSVSGELAASPEPVPV